jgi:hypothetical protein
MAQISINPYDAHPRRSVSVLENHTSYLDTGTGDPWCSCMGSSYPISAATLFHTLTAIDQLVDGRSARGAGNPSLCEHPVSVLAPRPKRLCR